MVDMSGGAEDEVFHNITTNKPVCLFLQEKILQKPGVNFLQLLLN
jgi:hypothetical protein